MKKNLFVIGFILVSTGGYSQTFNKKAGEYYNKGIEKMARKNYTEAIAEFGNALRLDSLFKQAYENRGVAKFYLQDYTGAIADYTKALEMDPYEYTSYGRRGWAKFCLNDFKGAITDLDQAVKGSKDKYRYCNFRGQVKFRLRDYEGAIADFNSVIKSPCGREQRSKAFYWRGMIKISMGQTDNGCQDLNKAVKLGYPLTDESVIEYCSKINITHDK